MDVTLKNCESPEDMIKAVKIINRFVLSFSSGDCGKECAYKMGKDALLVKLTKAGNVIGTKSRVVWLPSLDK